MGADTFKKMGGDLKIRKRSKNSFVFGDGPPNPSIGIAKISIRGYVFDIDIVSCDIPGLIGIDILSRHYKNRGIFRLSLGGRKLMIDDKEINLLGEKEGHLHLPNNVVKISYSFS